MVYLKPFGFEVADLLSSGPLCGVQLFFVCFFSYLPTEEVVVA